MKVTFYSTHCPKCRVVEKKLKSLNIEYTEIDDANVMMEKGLRAAPALQIDDGEIMNFTAAIKWLNSQGVKGE